MAYIYHPSRWQHMWWHLGTMLKSEDIVQVLTGVGISVLLIGAAMVALFIAWVLLCGLWSLIHRRIKKLIMGAEHAPPGHD
jgi:hypothetical protein